MIFYPAGITGLFLKADYFGKLFVTESLEKLPTWPNSRIDELLPLAAAD